MATLQPQANVSPQAIWMACNYVRPEERDQFIFSEAANKKIQGYIDLLSRAGIHVEVLSTASINQNYLRKRLSGWPESLIRMLYLPIRILLVASRVIAAIAQLVRNRNRVDCLFVYNYMPAVSLLAAITHGMLRKRVVLDYEDGLFLDRKGRMLKLSLESMMVRTADACVLVNRGLKSRLLSQTPFMILNGIFPDSAPQPIARTGERRISLLYSGNLSSDFGLELLLEALAGMESIEVHITGSGKSVDRLTDFTQGKSNIHYHGFVQLEELRRLESEVDGFLLFQNEGSAYYQTNFPSKLFHYLYSGKPVYFNHCSMFEPYEGFENARVISNTRQADEIIRKTISQPIDTVRLQQQIADYNRDATHRLKRILLGHE